MFNLPSVKRSELSREELSTLERLVRGGPHLNLSRIAVDRLMELRLAKPLLGGPGITEAGRRLLQRGYS